MRAERFFLMELSMKGHQLCQHCKKETETATPVIAFPPIKVSKQKSLDPTLERGLWALSALLKNWLWIEETVIHHILH